MVSSCRLGVDGRPRRLDRPGDDRADEHRLALQRDHAAGDARHVQQVVDQVDQVLDLALDDVAGARRAATRPAPSAAAAAPRCGSAPAGCAARAPASRGTRPCAGPPPAARAVVASSAAVRSATRCSSSRVQALQRARLAVQLGEHADLGPQDLRNDRHRHVVHARRTRSRAAGRGRSA